MKFRWVIKGPYKRATESEIRESERDLGNGLEDGEDGNRPI